MSGELDWRVRTVAALLTGVLLCGVAVLAAQSTPPRPSETRPVIERYDVGDLACYLFTVRGQVAVSCVGAGPVPTRGQPVQWRGGE